VRSPAPTNVIFTLTGEGGSDNSTAKATGGGSFVAWGGAAGRAWGGGWGGT